MPSKSPKEANQHTDAMRAVVMGEVIEQWPIDLFIPPDALEVVLDSFEGPLDLLLYLIRKQNVDILDIPVADITRQYMQYVELMHTANLDLAAEYLVMAALLGEIKSRMLLPKPIMQNEEEEDPRSALVKRLQEYERFTHAADEIDKKPRLQRDVFLAKTDFDNPLPEQNLSHTNLDQLINAYQHLIRRYKGSQSMLVTKDVLSMREKMTQILKTLQDVEYVRFEQLFMKKEGRLGVVVTFIALLELFRDDMLQVVQNEPFASIHIRAVR